VPVQLVWIYDDDRAGARSFSAAGTMTASGGDTTASGGRDLWRDRGWGGWRGECGRRGWRHHGRHGCWRRDYPAEGADWCADVPPRGDRGLDG